MYLVMMMLVCGILSLPPPQSGFLRPSPLPPTHTRHSAVPCVLRVCGRGGSEVGTYVQIPSPPNKRALHKASTSQSTHFIHRALHQASTSQSERFTKRAQGRTLHFQLSYQSWAPAQVIIVISVDQAKSCTASKAAARMEKELLAWIKSVLPEEELGEGTLAEQLKSGVALCNLLNALSPGCCPKPSTSKISFKQQENINNYLRAVPALGVKPFELFETPDLYENKNTEAVLKNLNALRRVAPKQPASILPAKASPTTKPSAPSPPPPPAELPALPTGTQAAPPRAASPGAAAARPLPPAAPPPAAAPPPLAAAPAPPEPQSAPAAAAKASLPTLPGPPSIPPAKTTVHSVLKPVGVAADPLAPAEGVQLTAKGLCVQLVGVTLTTSSPKKARA